MEDPVTLESGRTFDRRSIEEFFKYQEQARDEDGISVPFTCPISLTELDPEIKVPNLSLKAAIDDFYKSDPWAFEYDPRQPWNQIKLWAEDDDENL